MRADLLDQLFSAHRGRLYRLARRISRDAEEARDLVQETFVRLARQRGELPRPGAHAEGWLVRTLVNLCRDRERRVRVRRRHAVEHGAGTARVAPDPAVAMEARLSVAGALARLSPRRRAVIVLCELDGHSCAEAARLIGIRAVTVRWHLQAARRDLRRMLGCEEGERDA